MNEAYQKFIKSKHIATSEIGIKVDPSKINSKLHDWQREVVSWGLRKGRCDLFEDCGLGKTLQQLEWLAQLLNNGAAKTTLILCPVAVAPQTLREHAKFAINCEARIVADQSQVSSGINITNYEKLHKFDASKFDAVVLDEASILKQFAGKTKRALCEAFANTRFKLGATATPAPNDHTEIGNQAQFLGIMDSPEMLARWFINDSMKAGGYYLREHGRKDFWRWVCSWAIALSRPSDIGYSDKGYKLPPLNIKTIEIESAAGDGELFNLGRNVSATTVHVEKRKSLENKAAAIAELVLGNKHQWAVWVDTNYEADAIKRELAGPSGDVVEVRGSDSEEAKAERLQAFTDSQARVIITKPEIGGFGLNWQHCHKTTCMANFSFERFYQLIRRFLRFGQKHPVDAYLLASEAESNVVEVLRRKQHDYDAMTREMCDQMKDGMAEELGRVKLREYKPTLSIQLPGWIRTKNETVEADTKENPEAATPATQQATKQSAATVTTSTLWDL